MSTSKDLSASAPRSRSLVDPATGAHVEIVYALPSELMAGQPAAAEDGLSLADLWKRIYALKFLVIGVTLVCAALGVSVALILPNSYTAQVTALPPDSGGGGGIGASLGQYSDLASMAGISLPGGGGSAEEILAILGSRTLADVLVDEFKLKDYYQKNAQDPKRDDLIRAFLKDFSSKQDKKTTLITFQYTHESPQIVADLANRASVLLQDIFNRIHQGTSRRELAFLEGRLSMAEKDLLAAQEKLAAFQLEHRTFQLEDQAKATVEAIGQLQGQLIGQQVELRALLASKASPDNPEITLLKERIEGLAKAIDKLIGVSVPGGAAAGGGVLVGLGDLPELAVRYVGLYREVKKNEALVTTLTAQAESSRIAVVRENEAIIIIDRAQVPDQKSGPKRALISIAATLLGVILGIGLALVIRGNQRRLSPGDRLT
ncbi:hypothetical protein LBMAG53_14900 [Planctomycetota bacterium]|nr:hypothetical protein LBMAG53_14900 [Planctomycetota bacterium]